MPYAKKTLDFENTSLPFCFCTPQNSFVESKLEKMLNLIVLNE